MTYFLKNGNTYNVTTKASMDLHETLPPGNYVVKFREMGGVFYLEQIADFVKPKRIYGNTVNRANRILNTFSDRSGTTGLLLTGTKGSGKTLLAKTISNIAAEQGMPTVIVNSPFTGDSFNSFIQSIEQPIVLLFDEFEKVYDEEDQELILTLLDGAYHSQKLFIFTCNNKWKINDNMRNRPGRIYYMLEYKGLSNDFIEEYCMENMKNTMHAASLCRIASLFDQFSFDMLQTIVEEMNRYDESPQEVLDMINARPEYNERELFDVELLVVDGNIVTAEKDQSIHTSPMTATVKVDYKAHNDDKSDYDWVAASFTPSQITNIDSQSGKIEYVAGANRLVLIKHRTAAFNWAAF